MPDPAIEQLIQKLSVYERNQRAMVDRVVALEAKLGVTRVPVVEPVVQWPSQVESQCTRRHLTEAEEALCNYFGGFSGRDWDPDDKMWSASALGNIVRNERRNKPDAFEQSLREERQRELDADPCSCDEALELRRKLEEAEGRIKRALDAADADQLRDHITVQTMVQALKR